MGVQGSDPLTVANNYFKRSNDGPGFTLSLDCERLWGMGDQDDIVNADIINDVSLQSAYAFLLATLNRSNLKATVAFVTCFASESNGVRGNMPLFEQIAVDIPGWFSKVLPALRFGALNEWKGHEFYRSISAVASGLLWCWLPQWVFKGDTR